MASVYTVSHNYCNTLDCHLVSFRTRPMILVHDVNDICQFRNIDFACAMTDEIPALGKCYNNYGTPCIRIEITGVERGSDG